MRKNKFIVTISSGLFLLAAVIGVNRVKAMMPILPSNGIFGQNQYYSVVFNGKGEAAVAAKLVFQNNGSSAFNKVKIEIPGTNIRLIRAVQEAYSREEYCIQWNQVCTEQGSNGQCLKYERQCSQWHWRPKIWQPIYYALSPQIDELSNSVQYNFDLRAPIRGQEQGALLLYYKVPNYTKKSRGVFHFSFETIKVPYDVNYVRVAVNVQEGLYLKGGEAETQYRPNDRIAFKSLSPEAEGVMSSALSAFSNQISYARGYVKTTSGLDPWESFKVKGIYAKSHFALYRWQIIGSILGTLAFLASISGLIWWLIKRNRKKVLSQTRKRTKTNFLALKIFGTGIGSAIITIVLILLSFWLLQWMNYHISYRYQGFPMLLIMLISGILVLVTIFGPALYFGIKYGASKGVWVLLATIVTLIVIGGITLLLYVLFFAKHYYPPYPIYKGIPMQAK